MAGKATVLASRPMCHALDGLSKNTLIDLVVDLARRTLGEDAADDALIVWIQDAIGPVLSVRGDRPIDLNRRIQLLSKSDEDYRNKTGKHRQVSPGEQERILGALASKAGLTQPVFTDGRKK